MGWISCSSCPHALLILQVPSPETIKEVANWPVQGIFLFGLVLLGIACVILWRQNGQLVKESFERQERSYQAMLQASKAISDQVIVLERIPEKIQEYKESYEKLNEELRDTMKEVLRALAPPNLPVDQRRGRGSG